MKKLMTLVLLLFVVFQSWSQGFEGTVKWTMKMDITDPKMKAQMADADQKMKDPASQAKMKEMQARMEDPKFKAQMEANPQMKAQIEAMMKSMQGASTGGGINSMMPSGMTMKMKGTNTDMVMEGGMMSGFEILHMADKNQSVRLDRTNKTYVIMPSNQAGSAGKDIVMPKFTKTSETMKILGYNCTKYIAELKEGDKTVNQIFWTTNEVKGLDLKALSKQRMGQGARPMVPEGIDGVPMRIENSTAEGNMIMEITEIKKESLNAADFAIPSDFKETKMTGRGF